MGCLLLGMSSQPRHTQGVQKQSLLREPNHTPAFPVSSSFALGLRHITLVWPASPPFTSVAIILKSPVYVPAWLPQQTDSYRGKRRPHRYPRAQHGAQGGRPQCSFIVSVNRDHLRLFRLFSQAAYTPHPRIREPLATKSPREPVAPGAECKAILQQGCHCCEVLGFAIFV